MAAVVFVVLPLFITVNAKGTMPDFLLYCLRLPPELAPCRGSAGPTGPRCHPSPPLDARCFRYRQATPPPPTVADEKNLGNGEMEQEPLEKKRRRARFSDVQIVEMVKYTATELGWSLEGYDKDDLGEFCEAIEITPRSFKVWMKNNKSKYLEYEESSSSDENGGSII
ncbi:hypothetical protein ACSBR1_019132 [Camellia fascicularis]